MSLTSLVKLINNVQIQQPEISFSFSLSLPLFSFSDFLFFCFLFFVLCFFGGIAMVCAWSALGGCVNNIWAGCEWMSGWELEHSPAAEDVTTMGLLVVFQFEVYPACLTKGLIDLKSQVASITYNQVRLLTLKFPFSSFFFFCCW